MGNEVNLYFNGLITEQQLIVIVVAIVAIVIVVFIAKKILKAILTVGIVAVTLIYIGVISPDNLITVEKVIEEQGTKVIEELAEDSENIKLSIEDKDIDIQINPDSTDEWINIDDINKMLTNKEDCIVIIIDENTSYEITDKNVIKLLEIFKK